MFIGHFAVGFAAKKIAPKISLATSFMACQLLDLIWPILLLTGVEHAKINSAHAVTPIDFTYYPFSHSLSFVILWAILFGGSHFLINRSTKNSLVIGGLVMSHWVLDLIVHRPDLAIWPNGPLIGFGLWNHFIASFTLELIMFFTGAFIYWRSTAPLNRKGAFLLFLLFASLLIIDLANAFGPPPPNIMAVAYAGNLTWVFVLLGYWTDNNRKFVI